MNNPVHRFSRLLGDRRGVTALEYGLIAAVVIGVALAGFSAVGTDLGAKLSSFSTEMESAGSGSGGSGGSSTGG